MSAYIDFTTVSKVEKQFGLKQVRTSLLLGGSEVAASIRLKEDLAEAQQYYSLTSEKAKSELLIMPVLKELRRTYLSTINVFSGISLEVVSADLSGYCDFILSLSPNSFELKAPIFCLVEAKNRSVEEGFGQCAAEMYAAMLFNEIEGSPCTEMYGAVTTGYDWAFLHLQNKVISIDTDRYGLLNLPQLLGVFQRLITPFI